MKTDYDLIVVGGGPAGLSAAMYASRSKLDTLVLETNRKPGGQPTEYEEMENYPGVPETSAPELMENFKIHAEKFGAEIVRGEVTDIEAEGIKKTVKCKKGEKYTAKSVILATGAEPRKLGVKGEKEFKGKGVSYCATCDADFFVDLDVVVVGNGNSAIEEAIYLTNFVNKVTIIVIHEEGKMDAEQLFQERAYANDKIEFVWNSTIEEIKGEGIVEKAVVKDIRTGELTELPCAAVFFFVGRVPSTDFLEGTVDLNEHGYIKTNEDLETNLPGVYGAGDVIDKSVRQVVTAAGDGAAAAVNAHSYIEAEEYWQENVVEADRPVLVAFWSPTDEDSIESIGKVEEMDLEDEGYKFVKIDTYTNKLITDRYNIEKIPTLLKLKDGEEKERLVNPTQDEVESIL